MGDRLSTGASAPVMMDVSRVVRLRRLTVWGATATPDGAARIADAVVRAAGHFDPRLATVYARL
jgi:hypothetical protein